VVIWVYFDAESRRKRRGTREFRNGNGEALRVDEGRKASYRPIGIHLVARECRSCSENALDLA